MGQVYLINSLQYAGYALELSLLVLLLSPKRIRRFPALCAYVAVQLGVDALGRVWVLHHYGYRSSVYFYSYYASDFLLAVAVFLLVCTFFRRACRHHQKVWEFIRPILMWVLLLVIGISVVAVHNNFRHLFTTRYIFEFNQDLYFVCLVLNTVLYLVLQRFKAGSDLSLLVCGLGVQLAGPAAGSAFAALVGKGTILTYLSPICSLAMMAIWMYAITRKQELEHNDDSGAPKSKGTGHRRRISRADLVAPALQLEPVIIGGRSQRIMAAPGNLNAGYLHG